MLGTIKTILELYYCSLNPTGQRKQRKDQGADFPHGAAVLAEALAARYQAPVHAR